MPASRVYVRVPRPEDEKPYLAAVRRSLDHIRPWNPISADPAEFRAWLDRLERGELVSYLIVNREDDGLVGVCNVANIVRRRFQNATLGYNAFLPYAGTGRMTEGMRLVVDRCFAPEPEGLGLHLLEINVQPDNLRSIALARRLGFRYEGFSPRMLYINGAWRDHERFALTAEEWPD